MMRDGIQANGLHSQHDFDLCIKSRKIGLPSKKTIRQTVPFMNGYYDFSALNGSPAWNERKIEYSFDVIADTPAELEECAANVLDWLCNIHDTDIYDDTMPDYHWHGSYESCSLAYEDSGLAVEISVEFVCHPFKIANEPISVIMSQGTHAVVNAGMPVMPMLRSNNATIVRIGTYVIGVSADVDVKSEVSLERGKNTVTVMGDSEVKLWYYKEVM